MRIAIHAPGCLPGSDFNYPTRGEGRWGLNWLHILKEAGQEAVQVFDHPKHGFDQRGYDLYLNAGWWGISACSNPHFSFTKHCHLYFGVAGGDAFFDSLEKNYSTINCIRENRCNIVFGYPPNFYHSLSLWNKDCRRNYGIGSMPIPYSESMILENASHNFNRNAIAWMSKEVFHPNNVNNQTELYKAGLVYLEALVRFSSQANFVLYFMEDYPPTPEAASLLNRLPDVRRFKLLTFNDVLKMMSMVKINLAVGGTASSTLDAVFRRAVPLARANTFVNFTLSRERPEAVITGAPSVDGVFQLLNRMWLDYPFYRYMDEAHQSDFSDHRRENALIHFERFLETAL